MTPELLEEMTIAELVEHARELRTMMTPRIKRHHHQQAVAVQRGATVAGTGKALVITDPNVRKLVADLEAANATVSRAGDSHWKVEYQGRTANISSTPRNLRSVLNDRARVRRKLGVAV